MKKWVFGFLSLILSGCGPRVVFDQESSVQSHIKGTYYVQSYVWIRKFSFVNSTIEGNKFDSNVTKDKIEEVKAEQAKTLAPVLEAARKYCEDN